MHTEQRTWTEETGWMQLSPEVLKAPPQLVLVFGSTARLQEKKLSENITLRYPHAQILFCSTAGEIVDTTVQDDSLVVTAIAFEKTEIECVQCDIDSAEESEHAGALLAQALKKDELVHVIVFSDGLKVNGTALVQGLTNSLPADVSVTGGLAGDGKAFKKTIIGLNAMPREGKIVAIGFYGTALKVGYGSLSGWDPFGPERLITRAKDNVLYELDGKPALSLYKKYLGDEAKDLPSSALLFPLSLRLQNGNKEVEVVRTILAIDEKEQSMTFAGTMPEGAYARLMKANFERLIDGAAGAASMSTESLGFSKPELAILISCVGRKLVLKERTEEEIEAVREVVGRKATITGFYSYGEICPVTPTEKQCVLHNQTMTITTFREI